MWLLLLVGLAWQLRRRQRRSAPPVPQGLPRAGQTDALTPAQAALRAQGRHVWMRPGGFGSAAPRRQPGSWIEVPGASQR